MSYKRFFKELDSFNHDFSKLCKQSKKDTCKYVFEKSDMPFPGAKYNAECGFIYGLVRGYEDKKVEGERYHQPSLIKPSGVCMQCKRKIVT